MGHQPKQCDLCGILAGNQFLLGNIFLCLENVCACMLYETGPRWSWVFLEDIGSSLTDKDGGLTLMPCAGVDKKRLRVHGRSTSLIIFLYPCGVHRAARLTLLLGWKTNLPAAEKGFRGYTIKCT